MDEDKTKINAYGELDILFIIIGLVMAFAGFFYNGEINQFVFTTKGMLGFAIFTLGMVMIFIGFRKMRKVKEA